MKQNYLVSFDVTNDKIRRKVVRTLEEYGHRWQYSVFYCAFSKTERQKTLKKLEDLIQKTDSVFCIPISQQTLDLSDFIGQISLIINAKPEINLF